MDSSMTGARYAETPRIWKKYYELAEGMLGVVTQPRRTPADDAIEAISVELGVADTFGPVPVGVYFGEPGVVHADPYFGGAGPARSGCIECGLCLLGCRNNAKNTLPKNYLWFAERLGVRIDPERTVTSIRPLGAADGSDGYAVTSERTGSWIRKDRRTQTARGVVVAAGALGTNQLLAQCKRDDALPRISDRLGQLVRTNSEAMTAVTTPDDRGWGRRFDHLEHASHRGQPRRSRHVWPRRQRDGPDVHTPHRRRHENHQAAQAARPDLQAPDSLCPRDQSARLVTTLAHHRRHADHRYIAVAGAQAADTRPAAAADHPPGSGPPDAHFPAGGQRLRPAARRPDRWTAQSWLTEALFNMPITAHILGGAVAADTPEHGVVDGEHRVFGYQNLLVCDGAVIPANPGVNPSLTIRRWSSGQWQQSRSSRVHRRQATARGWWTKPDGPVDYLQDENRPEHRVC